jgi:hypothetical protein
MSSRAPARKKGSIGGLPEGPGNRALSRFQTPHSAVQALAVPADRDGVSLSPHLRGIVIAGALATLALALGLVTLAMNQSASKAATHTVLSLKQRGLQSAGAKKAPAVPRVKAAPVDPNLAAALKAGLPRSLAHALAAHPVVVVELSSTSDPVSQLASGEAQAGADLAGESYVSVDVDRNGGDASALTRVLGQLPVAPAALVYQRPATLYVTLPGFNDRTTVQQAAANAALTAGGSPTRVTAALAWSTRAGVLCKQTFQAIAALGESKTPAQMAASKVKFEAISASFLTRLKGLHAPAGQATKVAELNTLLAKNLAATDALLAAGAAKNAKAATAAVARTAVLAPRIQALEHQLGATGCAEPLA